VMPADLLRDELTESALRREEQSSRRLAQILRYRASLSE
jgi:hypothetical protein